MNLIGLDIKTVKEILSIRNIDNYQIFYRDTKNIPGFVVDEEIDNSGTLNIFVGVRSIIKNLPSNFHKNESLQNFLMIFQHFITDINCKLDNIHDNFNPMVADRKFLFWLSSWFSLDIGSDLPELNYRSLIKEIVPLYRWRGTKYGLERLLEIISGYKPEIIEHKNNLDIESGDSIDFYFTELEDSDSDVAICFPVSQKKLGKNTVKTIFNIVDKEKPAHINCRITFTPDTETNAKQTFIIGNGVFDEDSRF